MSALFINVVLLYGSPLLLACALIQFGLWFTNRQQKAYLYWGTVNLLGASGILLYLVRGSMPGMLSLLVPNVMVIGTGLLLWAGLRQFAQKPVRGVAFATALGAFTVVFAAVALSFEGVMPRVILVSLVLMVMNFGMMGDLWSQQRREYLWMRNVLIGAMLLHGLYYLVRAARAAYAGPEADLWHTSTEIDMVIVVGLVKTTVWNLATVLMVREARGALGFGAPLRTRNPAA